MPDFDIDSAFDRSDIWQPRVDWMNAQCDEREDRVYGYRESDDHVPEVGWLLPCASFSDYGGGTCERANVRSFKAMFGDAVQVDKGGYDSHIAWVSLEAVKDMEEEKWDELKDVIQKLKEDYPIIDEDMESEVRMELEDEAWDAWIKDDFLKELKRWFSDEMDEHVLANPQHEDIDERLAEHDFEIFRLTDPEYNHEEGGNVHVNIDRLVHNLDWSAVLGLLYPEDERQLKLNLRAESLVTALLETDGPHSYSSTQIDLPEELAAHVLKWSKAAVAEEDLFVDEDGGLGRETEMHVTVKYGLLAEEPSPELLAILAATEPFEIRLGRISLFTTNEDYDVVKLTVDSPGLRELNRQVSDACPNEDKFPSYNPHCTVAYVKKGRGAQFEGTSPWDNPVQMGEGDPEDGVFTADALTFSPSTDSGKQHLPFGEVARE